MKAKTASAYFKGIAELLPRETYQVVNKISGKEYQNLLKEYATHEDIPLGLLTRVTTHVVNHARRMRRIFFRDGKAAVNRYINKVAPDLDLVCGIG